MCSEAHLSAHRYGTAINFPLSNAHDDAYRSNREDTSIDIVLEFRGTVHQAPANIE